MTLAARRYVSTPSRGGGPGVLVLHEAWGLTDDIVWAADRLAGAGYVAVAPDLTGLMSGMAGSVAQLVAGRGRLIRSAMAELEELRSREDVVGQKLGVVGFSMGAALALLTDSHPAVGVIGFNYGLVPPRASRALRSPIVASFGAEDRLLRRGSTPLLRRLRDATEFDVFTYEGAGHSFMTPVTSRSSGAARRLRFEYRQDDADDAWSRLISFFHRHLELSVGSKPGETAPNTARVGS